MDLLKKKLIGNLVLFGAIGGGIIGAVIHFLLPAYSIGGWFVGILLLLIVAMVLVVNYVISASEKVTDRKLANVYMLILMVQMLVVLAIVTLYSLMIKENTPGFALSFILLFLLFLGLETWSFVKLEKFLKEKKQKG